MLQYLILQLTLKRQNCALRLEVQALQLPLYLYCLALFRLNVLVLLHNWQSQSLYTFVLRLLPFSSDSRYFGWDET